MRQFKVTSQQRNDGTWLSQGMVIEAISQKKLDQWILENFDARFDTEEQANEAVRNFCLKQGGKELK